MLKSRGIALVELVAAIVIFTTTGIVVIAAMGKITLHSAAQQPRAQALGIARALMEEIARKPFSYCDPNDAQFASAVVPADCTVSQDGLVPAPATEARLTIASGVPSTADPYDNVADYAAASSPVVSLDGQDLPGYSVQVSMVQDGAAFLGAASAVQGDALRITVTVNILDPDGNTMDSVVLQGYRTRYAPNSMDAWL